MELSGHDSQVLQTFAREYGHYSRHRAEQENLQASLTEARGKTGLRSAWAKAVTIPRLKKKLENNRIESNARMDRLKLATEDVLYSVGRKAMREDAATGHAGAILAQQKMDKFAVARYFFKLAELADKAEKKVSEAIGIPGRRSPIDYVNGYGGREVVNHKSVSEDYHALMDAAEYVRLFREHLHDAGAPVQKVFSQVAAARPVHDAMAALYRYPGSVDSMLMSGRPEVARTQLSELRDAIRRINDSFIREIVNAQSDYPGQSGKMNAIFLTALGTHKDELPDDGGQTLAQLVDAMRVTDMDGAPYQQPVKGPALKS